MHTHMKKIGLPDLVHAHATTRDPRGSDIGVLERYHGAVEENLLEVDALVYYGQLMDARDEERYIRAYAKAVFRTAEELDPEIWAKLRHRPGIGVCELIEKVPNVFAQSSDRLERIGDRVSGDSANPRYTDIVPVPSDPLSILIGKFRSHPALRAQVEPHLPAEHRHILSLLDRLEASSMKAT